MISSSKNIKQYNYIFFSEIYILKYPSPLFLLNTLFVNWKLSFLYWELNSSVILTLIFCECLKLIMVLLGTVHVHHGKLSARICCNLHHIMSLIDRWHTDTHTLTHLLFIKLSEFSPPHNAGSSSAKCVGKLMVTNILRSHQARIFSPAPTMEQPQLAFVNYLMQMLMKQPFFILSW